MNYKLPLATINHSLIDRIKLASFFLLPNQWSMGPRVKSVEKELAQRTGYNYCVATSSGSTANTLLAMWVAENTRKRKVVVSSVGWSTTITPFLRENFDPIFVDIQQDKPVMCSKKLDKIISKNKGEIAGVFYTTLLGIRDGMGRAEDEESLLKIKQVCELHGVDLYIDSCEDTAGMFYDRYKREFPRYRHYKIAAETTSFYLAHEFQACPEMGAIFTNDKDQYEFYLMARNHGMTRGLEKGFKNRYRNQFVDPKFEFGVVGNNFRPTELSAYAVSLDLKRKQHFRIDIAKEFYYSGSAKIYHYTLDFMFALPIVIRQEYGEEQAKYFIDKIKGFAEELGIETRPIVGGNLLRQTIFQEYGDYKDYPNAEWFHKYGIYVGLYKKMNKKILMKFRDKIDAL